MIESTSKKGFNLQISNVSKIEIRKERELKTVTDTEMINNILYLLGSITLSQTCKEEIRQPGWALYYLRIHQTGGNIIPLSVGSKCIEYDRVLYKINKDFIDRVNQLYDSL